MAGDKKEKPFGFLVPKDGKFKVVFLDDHRPKPNYARHWIDPKKLRPHPDHRVEKTADGILRMQEQGRIRLNALRTEVLEPVVLDLHYKLYHRIMAMIEADQRIKMFKLKVRRFKRGKMITRTRILKPNKGYL